ncbi:polysaccharide pyruvyl transferase family protein [Vibrio metschnikovii]|nr:polysaccharide pyruvyl transferase family protein [Vibrio metschnikovii]
MKIGLLTIHDALNYGAIFQAYATQEIFSRYGDVEIINYQNPHIKKTYAMLNIKFSSRFLKDIIREFCLLKSKISKKEKFNCFFQKYYSVTDKTNLHDINNNLYDVYVCGSDQIWNSKVTNGNCLINEDYFLKFAPEGAKKISYASSLGNHRFDVLHIDVIRKLLDRFDFISVREKDGAEYLEQILSREVTQVLDPTLLLSKDEWIKKLNLEEKSYLDDYILVYTVPRSDLLKDVVCYYSKTGVNVISVDSNLMKIHGVNRQIRDASPTELLNLILNAKMVITDSFHGVCFSINFRKNFLAISSGELSNRMENILNLVGMKNRFIQSLSDIEKLKNVKSEDYNISMQLLEEHKKESLNFISRAFSL